MNFVGAIDVGPQDREVLVGPFLMDEDTDTLWVTITQTSPPEDTWNYSYGLLTWRTVQGHELGTIKVYGHPDGETYKLSVGLPPRERYGDLIFTPRAYNRRWISIDTPPTWSLSFEAKSGKIGSGSLPDIPAFGTRATLGVLADLAGAGITYAITDGVAFIQLLK